MLEIIKLRNEAYEHLVIYLNIKNLPEINNLVRSVVDKIDDENILKNLTYFKYALDPANLNLNLEQEINKYSDYNLCLMFLILRLTKYSKYRSYTLVEIVNEFCKDYEHKINIDLVALYLINNFHQFYINMLCNEKDFLFNMDLTE
jgi:hypothetical protein